MTARDTAPTLADELDLDGVVVGAEALGALQQLPHGLPALVAVVARQLVDVHTDEAVGELGVQPAAELHRVLHRLFAVVEAGLDRLAQHLRKLEQILCPEVTPSDVRAE